MASWQAGDGSTVFTAAGSQNLFGGSGSWCGSGCGQCYELTNVGYVAGEGQGDCTGAGDKITVMITNLCPADGNAQWCSQPTDQYGYGAHFDILSQGGPAGWSKSMISGSNSPSCFDCNIPLTSHVCKQIIQSSRTNLSPVLARCPLITPLASARLAQPPELVAASSAPTISIPFFKKLTCLFTHHGGLSYYSSSSVSFFFHDICMVYFSYIQVDTAPRL